jgi:hypothetical protein
MEHGLFIEDLPKKRWFSSSQTVEFPGSIPELAGPTSAHPLVLFPWRDASWIPWIIPFDPLLFV